MDRRNYTPLIFSFSNAGWRWPPPVNIRQARLHFLAFIPRDVTARLSGNDREFFRESFTLECELSSLPGACSQRSKTRFIFVYPVLQVKRGYVSLVEEEFDKNSSIDPVWLEKEINQTARTAFNRGLSKENAAATALRVYEDDLKRLMPGAFERTNVIFARIEGCRSAITQ